MLYFWWVIKGQNQNHQKKKLQHSVTFLQTQFLLNKSPHLGLDGLQAILYWCCLLLYFVSFVNFLDPKTPRPSNQKTHRFSGVSSQQTGLLGCLFQGSDFKIHHFYQAIFVCPLQNKPRSSRKKKNARNPSPPKSWHCAVE